MIPILRKHDGVAQNLPGQKLDILDCSFVKIPLLVLSVGKNKFIQFGTGTAARLAGRWRSTPFQRT